MNFKFLFLIILPLTFQTVFAKSNKEDVKELLKALQVKETIGSSLDASLDMIYSQNPGLKLYQNEINSFYKKHMSYKALEEKLILLYGESFTEKEIKDLLSFYNSETGKKVVTKMPDILRKASELGAEQISQNSGELEKLIESADSKRTISSEKSDTQLEISEKQKN